MRKFKFVELPSSTVLGVTLQKLKVSRLVASMTVIASVVYPVIPFISYIIGKMFIGVSDAFPLGESILYSCSYYRHSSFDVRLLKQC